MNIKELLKTMLRSFFVITTGVITSMYVFCLIFNPDASFSLHDIGRVLLMALVSELPFIIFYSRRELSKKQMLIRQAVHLPVLLADLLFFAQLWNWVNMGRLKEIIVFILLVISVYVMVLAAVTYQDQKLAEKLNDSLKKRYPS